MPPGGRTHELFSTVREAARPGLWSKGVRLARDGRALVESSSADEIWLRVSEPARAIAASVGVYPEDEEWTCDCDSSQDPCQHVTAAVIALHQAELEGRDLASLELVEAKLNYRFRLDRGVLRLDRVLVYADGTEKPLTESMAGQIGRGGAVEGFTPSHDDLTVDRILTAMLRGDVLEDRMGKILAAISGETVSIDGLKLRVNGDPLLPRVRVFDFEDAVVLSIEPPPNLERIVCRGLAIAGGKLCAFGEVELTGGKLERLPLRRAFTAPELGELVAEALPEFEARFDVEIESTRLPKQSQGEPPRIAFDLKQGARQLTVLPTLVYGDPARARIDNGNLVLLGGDVPRRDEARERELLRALRDELNLVPGRRVELNGSEATRFASKIKTWAAGRGDAPSRQFFGETPLVPRLVIDGDRFDISFDLGVDDDEGVTTTRSVNAEAVLGAWREGLDLVPLDGGGWAPLPRDWLSRFGHHVADLLTARSDDGEVSTVGVLALAELCAELDQPPPPSLARLEPLLNDFEGIPDAALPDDLDATLRPYQVEGVSWLSFLKSAGLGAVLADDMGLGKTIQTLCVLGERSLVICPRSVIHNWASEIQKFRPGLSVNIYHGTGRTLNDAEVTLTTYALLRLDVAELAAKKWDSIVVDEAQAIKNPDSQVARAAYRLNGNFRASLSGTPVENRLDELWSQLHFTNPGLLGGRKDFVNRYSEPILHGSEEAAERLRARIKPFVLRRLKRDVVPELPPRTDVTLTVELDETERNIYDSIRAATRKEVVAKLKSGGNMLAALEALLRLRQAACHPALVPGQQATTSSKVSRLLLGLESAAADGHKALVFSQWTSLLDLVEPHLERAEIPFLRLDGSTRDRQTVVEGFQDSAGPPVLLVSLKAGGTGLNLTAADHVFLLDPWWNPAVEEQAADRAHRIGQERPVMVYRLVAKDTVEEGILALQERKRHLADAALGGAAGATQITRDELLALLE